MIRMMNSLKFHFGRLFIGTILLFLLLAQTPIYSQKKSSGIAGTVIDVDTKKPLYGVNVMLVGTILGDATDMNGCFNISMIPAGVYTVKISMMGYSHQIKENINVLPDSTVNLQFRLKQTVIKQPALIITASKRKQSIENTPTSVDVISRRQITTRNMQSLEEVIQNTPGVNIIRGQVDIRGSSGFSWAAASRVLFMLDGHPLISGDTEGINWDIVPIEEIKRIEIIKGAGSSLYGSNAMAGMINIITKDPSLEPKTGFKFYWGFFDQPSHEAWRWTDAFIPYQLSNKGKIDFSTALTYEGINVSHSRRFGNVGLLFNLDRKTSTGYQQNGNYSKWNGFGKIKIKFAPNITLNLSGIHSSIKRGDFIQWINQSRALEVAEEKLEDWVHSERSSVNCSFIHAVNKQCVYTLRTNLYRNYWKNYFSDNQDFSISNRYCTEASVNYLWRKHDMTFGGELIFYNTDSNFYGNRNVNGIALFAEDQIEFSNLLRVIFGARFDYHRSVDVSSDKQISPRAGIILKPWKGSSMRFSVGHGFRAPSIAELFTKTIISGFIVEPNPELKKAERSWTVEVGFRQVLDFSEDVYENISITDNPVLWMSSLLKPAFIFDVSFFWSRYYNMIEPTQAYQPDSSIAIQFKYLNNARNIGAEAKLQASFLDGLLTARAGYTYIKPVDLLTGQILNYRSQHRINIGTIIKVGSLSAGWDYRYSSRIKRIVNLVGSAYEQRVPMHVMDARLSMERGAYMVVLECKNLLNYNYTLRQRYVEPIRSFVISIRGEI